MMRTAVAAGAAVLALGLGAAGVAGAGRDAGPPRAAVEMARAADATGEAATSTAASVTARTYAPPLDPPVVVARPFDGPAVPWAAGHRGVDLAAEVGQAVRAPQGGVVAFAGTVVDRGVVTVAHDDGLRSSLEPVRWTARPGERVVRGQSLGTVAEVPGHCAPATCLHWGLRRGDAYLDPMRWVLGRGPVVLLPDG